MTKCKNCSLLAAFSALSVSGHSRENNYNDNDAKKAKKTHAKTRGGIIFKRKQNGAGLSIRIPKQTCVCRSSSGLNCSFSSISSLSSFSSGSSSSVSSSLGEALKELLAMAGEKKREAASAVVNAEEL